MSHDQLKFLKWFFLSLLTTLSVGTTALAATPDNQYESVEMVPYPIFMMPESSLAVELQDQQVQAAAYLFDRDLNTAYSSAYPAQIMAPFGDLQTLNSLRIYGAAPFLLNIQAKQNDTWVPVKGLENIDLFLQPDQWNSFTATEAISTTELLLNLVPLTSNPSGGLREIEFWVQRVDESNPSDNLNSTTEVTTLPTSADSASQGEEVVKGRSKVRSGAIILIALQRKSYWSAISAIILIALQRKSYWSAIRIIAQGVTLIEPPQANNMGSAGLSYPLEVPPGRAGLQPQLRIQYNSADGNGWLGLG